MSDYIRLLTDNDKFTYINLENIISIECDKNKRLVKLSFTTGNITLNNETMEDYEHLEKCINVKMESIMKPK